MAKKGLGIDIGLNAIRVVELKQSRGGMTVLKACAIEMEGDPISKGVEPAMLDRVQKGLQAAGLNGQKGLPAIPGREGILKYFYVPTTVQKNLRALLKIVTTTTASEGIATGWAPVLSSMTLSGNQLYMVALCKNEVLQKGLSLLEKGGLRSRRFTLRSTGLHSLAQRLRLCRGEEAILVAELDRQEVNLVILIGSELVYARAFSYSNGGFTEKLKQRFTEFPEDEAYLAQAKSQVNLFTSDEEGHAELFRPIAQGLVTELRQSIQAAQAQLKLKALPVEKVYLCGEDSGMAGLAEYLSDLMGKSVQVVDPFDGMTVKSQKKGKEVPDKSGLAVAVGLALADLSCKDKEQTLSLTPRTVEEKEYFWSHTAYRYYAVGIAFLTALFIYVSGTYSLNTVDRVNTEIDQQLQQAKGKKEQLLGITVGLEEVEKQLGHLTEGFYRPEPALDILEEIGRVTPSEIGLRSVDIKNTGPGFPFDQGQMVTLTGFLHDRGVTEVAFIEKVDRYARALEQAPGFVQRKIQRMGEPKPIRQTGALAVDNKPSEFQFQFQLPPGR